MSTVFTLAGVAFNVAGIVFVFIELAVIRSNELGVPPPWTALVGRIRRLLRRPKVIHLHGVASMEFGASLRAKVRPSDLEADASDHERIEWLTRYVAQLDRELDGVWDAIGKRAEEVVAEAARRDAALRREFEQRAAEQKARLRPSLRRQAAGALCLFAGVGLGLAGNLTSRHTTTYIARPQAASLLRGVTGQHHP